ncbi:MAG TPA: ABC transporter permease subunit/CPBP intramembrane protease, partial [Lacipirellulaceae bacterium]|nr:ABC transporter permease subunit/CPBP intramembrane protease [Lacipirellulaceae bacterium]
MTWRNIRLIYAREIRDQLRDRRTLFMIAVLPLLLYPLLGMSVFQLSQFLRKSEPKVVVIGSQELKLAGDLPPLINGDHFAADLFHDEHSADWLHLEFAGESVKDVQPRHIANSVPTKREVPAKPSPPSTPGSAGASPAQAGSGGNRERAIALAEHRLKNGDIQAVLIFPEGFGKQLRELHAQIQARVSGGSAKSLGKPAEVIEIPKPRIQYSSGKEKSRVAHMQVERVVEAWEAQIERQNLVASRVPPNVTKPFELEPEDVAGRRQQQALMWSKVLPFVLFIWALTGAFYPAVDLCAGEKERGTLETLLSSPARRIEIVWGKLLTVMTFSAATAVLNLASLGFTARYVVSQLRLLPTATIGNSLNLPPLSSALWLLAALVPMSALFSALCLACAAFARSTKEGQYYLMPLLLVSMPLMMLPMAPGTELNLGNSLIPVTGVVLLVMSLVQGNFAEAMRYVVPVCGVTLICCHLAIRWAVYQFNQESVLFSESERLDPRRWLLHLVRDRKDTPTLGEAFFGVVLIYVIQFFLQVSMSANVPDNPGFGFLATTLVISQVVCFALPAVLLAVALTGRPLKTLLLDRRPKATACFVAVLLALLLHPFGLQLGEWIRSVYPVQERVQSELEHFAQLLATAPYTWLPYAMMALLPAVCEELAFRGFVLSGLRHLGSKRWAIGLAAVFFGLAHGIIQQSLGAAALGLVIGYIAVQTSSLVPCMLFHATYNGLMFGTQLLPKLAEKHPGMSVLYHQSAPGQILYNWPVVVVCSAAAIAAFVWLHRLPYQATREEQL